MDDKTFLKELRKMIREEVTFAVRNLLKESVQPTQQTSFKQDMVHVAKLQEQVRQPRKPLPAKPSLMDILNETKEEMMEEAGVMQFTSKDAQNFQGRGINPAMFGYGDASSMRMGRSAVPETRIPQVDIEGRPVTQLDPVVEQAITRDYSAVMKTLKDKKKI